MFQAFLNLSDDTIINMSIEQYIDYMIVFREAMNFRHAPFKNNK